jgi:sulfur-oxidizing protein SoxY
MSDTDHPIQPRIADQAKDRRWASRRMLPVRCGRRAFLQHGGATLAVLACGLFAARSSVAGPDFGARSMQEALASLGGMPATGSQLTLRVPETVEDGAVVPVAVETALEEVEEIYVLVASNPFPLAARFDIPPGTEPAISLRVKMAQSGDVHAVVRSGGMLYGTSRRTLVTVGGCA